MTAESPDSDRALTQAWQRMIRTADRHNIFCRCRECHYEWVDSSRAAPCPKCGSPRIERVACWQFPDG